MSATTFAIATVPTLAPSASVAAAAARSSHSSLPVSPHASSNAATSPALTVTISSPLPLVTEAPVLLSPTSPSSKPTLVKKQKPKTSSNASLSDDDAPSHSVGSSASSKAASKSQSRRTHLPTSPSAAVSSSKSKALKVNTSLETFPTQSSSNSTQADHIFDTYLTEPVGAAYTTHATVDSSLAESGEAVLSAQGKHVPKRKRASGKRKRQDAYHGLSKEERRERLHLLLHELHVHASEEDLAHKTVFFPPGLLGSDADMQTFFTEFNALSLTHNNLMSMISSMPSLMLTLDMRGRLQSYNHDPEPFFGISLTTMKTLGYHQWFSTHPHNTTSASRTHLTPPPTKPFAAFRDSQNASFLTSIALAYKCKAPIREEHCMFVSGGSYERPTAMSLTVLPIFYSHTFNQDSSFSTLRWLEDPPSPKTTDDTLLVESRANNVVSLGEHAFGTEEEQLLQKQRLKDLRAETKAAQKALRAADLRGVSIIIEEKDLLWKLTQNSKRIKEIERMQEASNHPRHAGSVMYGVMDKDSSVTRSSTELDSNIASAVSLMTNLAHAESSQAKKRLYNDIIRMLKSSNAQDSVNDKMILQIEESQGVNSDLKDWLISQINPSGPAAASKDGSTSLSSGDALFSSSSSSSLSAGTSDVVLTTDTAMSASTPSNAASAVQSPIAGTPRTGLSARSSMASIEAEKQRLLARQSLLTARENRIDSRVSLNVPVNALALAAGNAANTASSSHSSLSSNLNIDVVESIPSALIAKPADDAQFLDPSPEVSLITSKPSITNAPIPAPAAAGTSQVLPQPQSQIVPDSNSTTRPSVMSARHSMKREGKSVSGKATATTPRKSVAAPSPTMSSRASTITRTSTQRSFVAAATPLSSSAAPSLPLLDGWVDKRVVIEKVADARIIYVDHQSEESCHEAQLALQLADIADEKALRNRSSKSISLVGLIEQRKAAVVAAEEAGLPNDGAVEPVVVTKEIVFKQVGCPIPEVHHNAAADVNQPLFFTNLWVKKLSEQTNQRLTSVSVSGEDAVVSRTGSLSRHRLLHPRLQFSEAQGAALARSLSCISVWNEFNVFHVSTHSQGWPLTFTFTTIMTQLNLIGKWGIDAELCTNFIREIERGYFANPYHSSTHAADVLQHCYHTVTQTHLAYSLNDLDLLLLFVAAAVHDFGHPGVANQFLTTTLSPLSLQYNDKNVLENYHIASAFLVMQSKPDCNILAHMDNATFRKSRKILIELVLATDLAEHAKVVQQFKLKESQLDLSKDEDKTLVMQMVLKSGDLGHPSRVRSLHLTWSELITEEFFQQGDRERSLGLPVNQMQDRQNCKIPQSQIGFINFLVMPIYSAFASYINNDMYHTLVKANLAMWERLNNESAELQAIKEQEENVFRRMAYERQELDERKKREAQALSEEKKRLDAEFEREIEQANREELEAQLEKARKEQEEQLKAARAIEEAVLMSLPKLDAPIIDVRLQFDEEEWADVGTDEEDQEAIDAAEEAERLHRRSVKESLAQAEADKKHAERQKQRESIRAMQREMKAGLDGEQSEGSNNASEESKLSEDAARSIELEEAEIEARKISRSESMVREIRRKRAASQTQSAETLADDEKQTVINLEPTNRPRSAKLERKSSSILLQSINVNDEFSQLDSSAKEEESSPVDDQRTQGRDDIEQSSSSSTEVDRLDDESAAAAEDEEIGSNPSSDVETLSEAVENGSFGLRFKGGRQKSSSLIERERIAARIKSSIRADRAKVESRKKVLRLPRESDPKLRELQQLERWVRRALEKERKQSVEAHDAEEAAASARSSRASSISTPSSSDHNHAHHEEEEKTQTSAPPSAPTIKPEVLKARLESVRAVSMMLMDKEWGVKLPAEQEKQVYLDFLEHIHLSEEEKAADALAFAEEEAQYSARAQDNRLQEEGAENEDYDDEEPERSDDKDGNAARSSDDELAFHDATTSPNAREQQQQQQQQQAASKMKKKVRVWAPDEEVKEQISGDEESPSTVRARFRRQATRVSRNSLVDELLDTIAPLTHFGSTFDRVQRMNRQQHRSPSKQRFTAYNEPEDRAHHSEEEEGAIDDTARVDTKAVTQEDIDSESQRRHDLQQAMRAQRARARQQNGPARSSTVERARHGVTLPSLAASMTNGGPSSSRQDDWAEMEEAKERLSSVPALRGAKVAEGANLLLTRALFPTRATSLHRQNSQKNKEALALEWREDDEAAMETVLRRIIPRTRQAELDRYRKVVLAKLKANQATD